MGLAPCITDLPNTRLGALLEIHSKEKGHLGSEATISTRNPTGTEVYCLRLQRLNATRLLNMLCFAPRAALVLWVGSLWKALFWCSTAKNNHLCIVQESEQSGWN